MDSVSFRYGPNIELTRALLLAALEREFDLLDHGVKLAEERASKRFARDIVNWMRENRPWHDRTGDARRLLWADARTFGNEVDVTIGHGVDYGRFLELGYAGKYAIIMPAMQYWEHKWPEYMEVDIGNAIR